MSGFRIGGVVAAFLVLVGSFLPWATISFLGEMSMSGMEGDGKITFVLAIAAGVLIGLWKRPLVLVAAGVAGLAALIALIDLIDVGRVAGDLGGFIEVSPGFGLILTLLAALATVALAVLGQAQLAKDGQAGIDIARLTSGGPVPTTSLPPQPQAPAAPVAAVPAGWHPDPYGGGGLRYWDGARWTEHVAPAQGPTPTA